MQPLLGVKKLQAVVADRVGVAPHQISAALARPRRARRVPLDEGADLAAAAAREGAGCYVLASLRCASTQGARAAGGDAATAAVRRSGAGRSSATGARAGAPPRARTAPAGRPA